MTDQQQRNPGNSLPQDEFTRLFTVNQRSIYLYIRSLVANTADVDEIWGETNLVLWQRFADFQPGTSFIAWARRIAYNKILNYRTRRRQPVQFSDGFMEKLAATAERLPNRDKIYLDAINRCSEKLSRDDWTLIQLRYSSETGCQRVAEILGRPVHFVYKALTRIRSQLLDCVRREVAEEDRE